MSCEILHTFIQRVEVGECAKRYDRNAQQEIQIYYCDIGLIDEMPETMAEEMNKPTQAEVAYKGTRGCAKQYSPAGKPITIQFDCSKKIPYDRCGWSAVLFDAVRVIIS